MPSPLYFGFNPPFTGGPQNFLSPQTDERLIKNDLLQGLLTVPGERVYRPTFGTTVKSSVFDLNDAVTVAALRQTITAMVAQDERVILDKLTITSDVDGQTVKIRLVVARTGDPLSKYVIEITKNVTQLTATQAQQGNVPRG